MAWDITDRDLHPVGTQPARDFPPAIPVALRVILRFINTILHVIRGETVDPVAIMLQGTPENVYEAAQYCMTVGGPRSISGAGCEVPDGTPHENFHAQSRALREMVNASS